MATQRGTGAGVPTWVWWILGLIVVLIAIALLLPNLFGADPGPGTTAQPAPAVAPAGAPAAGEPVTDVPFGQPDQLQGMVGEQVRLESVMVQDVVSDRGFWVGPSATERIFVRLDEQAQTPQTATEGLVDVNQGEQITLEGQILDLPPMEQMQQQWGDLDSGSLQSLENNEVYIRATEVNTTP